MVYTALLRFVNIANPNPCSLLSEASHKASIAHLYRTVQLRPCRSSI